MRLFSSAVLNLAFLALANNWAESKMNTSMITLVRKKTVLEIVLILKVMLVVLANEPVA